MTALEESIKHWDELTRVITADEIKIGHAHCPLCIRHWNIGELKGCGECPVRASTGNDFCVGSPYRAADLAAQDAQYFKWLKERRQAEVTDSDIEEAMTHFRSHAVIMRDFLIGLRKYDTEDRATNQEPSSEIIHKELVVNQDKPSMTSACAAA